MTLKQLKYVVTIAEKGSMNEASKELFVSQPSLSESLRDLEAEIGVQLFIRTNRGITITNEGKEFLGYARQMVEQYQLMEERYIQKEKTKKKFHVSTQHYTFAVKAFVELVKQFGMEEYEFAIYETRTYEIMEDVRNFRSDIGVLYMDSFNEKAIKKLLKENELIFHELFRCRVYVYLSTEHPLADRPSISMKDLEDYPCVSFDQGNNNSFYLAEEVLSTYEYKKMIKVNDRATVLNMMIGMNGYTLCSGILCEELNGEDYRAVPLETDEIMRIGYITRKDVVLNELGKLYLEELKKCNVNVLES